MLVNVVLMKTDNKLPFVFISLDLQVVQHEAQAGV